MTVKFNSLFPWLSIRNKLLIAFAGLSIFPLTLVGIYNILSTERLMRQVALQELTGDVHTIREKTENFLNDISSDMRVLQNSSSMESWMKNVVPGAGVVPAGDLTRIGNEILSFAKTKEIYYQFRLLDGSGDELLRVECDNPNGATKTFSLVPPSGLSQGSAPYYFLLIDKLGRNQIAFAPAEVGHRENERIPVISFALPLLSRGRRVGILIANVFEKDLLNVIETRNRANPERKVVLVTGDGHYLYHSDKKRDWNRLLASREEDNLERDYSSTVAASILSGREGTVTEGTKEIISYAPLFETTPIPANSRESLSFFVPITVFVSVPENAVMGPARSYTVTLFGFLVVFLCCAIALGFLATRQFIEPISQLQRGAEIIAEGRYEHRLDVETHDEIERLAGQFNRMAASLEAHDQELRAHRMHLEDMVSLRTKELSEEKTKLQLLLDNVPSAFVLLDRNYRILTVSAAFTRVTGLPSVGAIGKHYAEVDEVAGSLWASAFSDGDSGSRTRTIRHPDSGDRLLEYVAVPMKAGNESTALLLIITDITERKRLEQQMVRTEKLVAAAEMSSMIAHEFRNALTSVKMIVQLFGESEHFNRAEKKSLGVALDSIRHMERIVTELLSFARPKPLQFKPTNINRVLRDSIDFIRPHAQRIDISLASAFDADIGEIPLDESLLKEAMINILLNGIQAIEVDGRVAKRGKVTATSKIVILPTALTGGVDRGGTNKTGDPGITLPRRSPCVRITISDNGCGITDDHLDKIFDPFYTTKTNGTGLGLPMVQRTIAAHGGILQVSTLVHKGTTFSIYLPLTNGKANERNGNHSRRG